MVKNKRKWIGYEFEKWLKKLHLYGWDLYVLIEGEDKEFEQHENGGLSVKVMYPYKEIHLSVNKKALNLINKQPNDVKDLLLHEAVHVLLWDYSYKAESRYVSQKELADCEERLVEHIKGFLLEW